MGKPFHDHVLLFVLLSFINKVLPQWTMGEHLQTNICDVSHISSHITLQNASLVPTVTTAISLHLTQIATLQIRLIKMYAFSCPFNLFFFFLAECWDFQLRAEASCVPSFRPPCWEGRRQMNRHDCYCHNSTECMNLPGLTLQTRADGAAWAQQRHRGAGSHWSEKMMAWSHISEERAPTEHLLFLKHLKRSAWNLRVRISYV